MTSACRAVPPATQHSELVTDRGCGATVPTARAAAVTLTRGANASVIAGYRQRSSRGW